jgi:hypothetical protein
MGPGKHLIVGGSDGEQGVLVLEAGVDADHLAPVAQLSPVDNPPPEPLPAIMRFARIRRLSGSGDATAAIGGAESLLASGTLGVAALDTSTMGRAKSVYITGSYAAPVVVEATEDGSSWAAVAQFDASGAAHALVTGTFKAMRLREATGAVVQVISAADPGSTGEGFEILSLSSSSPDATLDIEKKWSFLIYDIAAGDYESNLLLPDGTIDGQVKIVSALRASSPRPSIIRVLNASWLPGVPAPIVNTAPSVLGPNVGSAWIEFIWNDDLAIWIVARASDGWNAVLE